MMSCINRLDLSILHTSIGYYHHPSFSTMTAIRPHQEQFHRVDLAWTSPQIDLPLRSFSHLWQMMFREVPRFSWHGQSLDHHHQPISKHHSSSFRNPIETIGFIPKTEDGYYIVVESLIPDFTIQSTIVSNQHPSLVIVSTIISPY